MTSPTNRALMQAYVPIARGYLLAAAVYYCLISLSHPFYETGAELFILDGLSIVAACYGLAAWRALRGGNTQGLRLEGLVMGMNGLFLANVVVYQSLHFEPQKLVYFVLMALVFATSAPSRRVALVSVGLAVAGLVWMARHAPGDTINQYMFLALAGAFAAGGMSTLMRGVVGREVRARLASDALNAELQRELKENRRLQGKAEALALAAQTANRAKTDFLATMSHEIRTPLNGVLGMAQIMESGALEPEQRRRLGIITTSGQSLLGVINAILDISRIEAGRMEIIPAPFAMEGVLEGLRQLYGGLAREKGLTFELDIAPTATGWRLGDAQRLRQVLSNLISNAIKFTDAGAVRVSVRGDGDTLAFQIADSGVGIPETQRDLIFGKFVQLDSSSTRRAGGAGLGLAICKELVGLMGGRIDFASLPDGGTRFSFSTAMPQVEATEGAVATLPDATLDNETPLRVLVVDDNDTNRTVLLTLLGHLGVSGQFAVDGREAVAMWERERWDAILMDIHMPGMDGIEASRTIREREGETGRPRTPIIAVTASVLTHERMLYSEAGMDGLIPKPIEVVKLVETMTRVLAPPAPEDARASA
ncbi:ATP-binding protein [Caulobacter sp.]|uniref:ATP-binding protein n=1 Tax=Caulobacter sp. TaxID=78 RepID=UPI003BACF0FD